MRSWSGKVFVDCWNHLSHRPWKMRKFWSHFLRWLHFRVCKVMCCVLLIIPYIYYVLSRFSKIHVMYGDYLTTTGSLGTESSQHDLIIKICQWLLLIEKMLDIAFHWQAVFSIPTVFHLFPVGCLQGKVSLPRWGRQPVRLGFREVMIENGC